MLPIKQIALLTILAIVALTACVADPDQEYVNTPQPAQIESAKDLEVYLRNTPSSPLDRLSAAAKQRFLESLTFSDQGLGSYRYSDLEAELSPEDIHQILSMFGVEHTISLITGARSPSDSDRALMQRKKNQDDHEGYRCISPGTCYKELNYICTSNC